MVWIACLLVACSVILIGMAKRSWHKYLDHRKERVWWMLNVLTGLSGSAVAYFSMGDSWWKITSLDNILSFTLSLVGVSFGLVGVLILTLDFWVSKEKNTYPHN